MRWRAVGLISLAANIVLVVCVGIISHQRGAHRARGEGLEASKVQTRTNYVVRRQIFSWREIESPDYPTYILNLRDIGCPEQTIRDIIIADVNSLYAQKRATNLVTSEQQWWRTEPDPAVVRAAAEKSRELEDERRALLTKLLGTNWEAGDMASLPRPSRPGVVLDGALLGTLSADTKQAIEDITERSQDRLQAYLDAQRNAGKDADPSEITRLRQQTRAELQRVLSPPQLEEFLLRYSQNANNLRTEFGQLRFFNPSPNEFRDIFRATDGLDQQIQLLEGSTDPADVAHRKTLLDQRELAIKNALGADRYQDYTQLSDPAFRDAMATALQAGTPDAAQAIYAANIAVASEQARINADTNLTTEQKAVELKRVELEQAKATAEATGQEVPPEPPAPPQPPPRKIHVIRPGDSPAVLSLLYGVPFSSIQAANPNANLNHLRPGDTIFLPPRSGAPFSGP
jgi:hypothetical protein